MKRRSLVSSQVDLNYLFDATLTQLYRDSYIQAIDAVLAFKIRRARKDFLLVFQDRFNHFDGRGRRRVISRSGLQQAHYLSAAISGASYDLIDLVLRQQIGQRNTRNRRIARQGD